LWTDKQINPLETEFDFYLENQDDLVKKYNGKYIVIKNNVVIGAYSSDIEALTETSKTHEMGTFLIQHCSPGENDYTAHFHSRVIFA
jgi:hypothetical protein